MSVLTVLILIALGFTLLILLAGVVNLSRGGEKARKLSNKLMRMRIVAQLTAILLLGLLALTSGD